MALPVYLQNFKAAGIYRVVFDKSTILGTNAEILRLVVGYSEVGPFNTPVYITSVTDFKNIFGDVSKKLEKRGIFFHRIAIQCLAAGPILCLNLKKFSTETVDGVSISTNYGFEHNSDSQDVIDTVKLKVEDIFDTTRFWTLDATKLPELSDADTGKSLSNYINIAATNSSKTGVSYFIRKANGSKVSGYNVSVSDWYKDAGEDIPDYLIGHEKNLISDFFAEIYVFNGKFEASQVMSSETLKKYFEVKDGKLQLRPYIIDAFGDAVDTLDYLYSDETSGALTHYVGCLIPYFKDKQNVYRSLDILFNNDIDTHHLMMSFDVDQLYEADEDGSIHQIDLSGKYEITGNVLDDIFGVEGSTGKYASTDLLGNFSSPIVVYKQEIGSVTETGTKFDLLIATATVNDSDNSNINIAVTYPSAFNITIKQALNDKGDVESNEKWTNLCNDIKKGGVDSLKINAIDFKNIKLENVDDTDDIIIEFGKTSSYTLDDSSDGIATSSNKVSTTVEHNVYDAAISLISVDSVSFAANAGGSVVVPDGSTVLSVKDNSIYDTALSYLVSVGDIFVGAKDLDGNTVADKDTIHDIVFVQEVNTDTEGQEYVVFTGEPCFKEGCLIRINDSLNKEIGEMRPQYLEGYVYQNDKPKSSTQYDKLQWQKDILSVLSDYKGLRTGLLNKSDIDYRYVIDTFESYVDNSCKKELSYLCKEKISAFAILNFPAARTFIKCPYTSFTDDKGIFNVNYVVKGYNPKKAHSTGFSLPTNDEGASFCAFYTPCKISDGYVDTIVPSAGVISNLFMEKYMSRQPYYIVAGPNHGVVTMSGLVGPDYNYSSDELNVIEPYGVNCLVYRPGFGTFINANQTAKQTPKSALSSVNVRELVIYLQDEIEKLLQSYQWEFNNATVRNKIKDRADVICTQIMQNGGIQDFLNVMDESNNTPEIIDNEMAILSTHIEPGRGMGKMVHELTIYKTGQMRASISE